MTRWTLTALLGALILLAASPALACGGLFCAVPAGPNPPEPVDQNAERIIFEINDEEETITAHVQIQYAGSPDGFAWVIPVPSVPEVEESNISLFQRLDEATRLQVQRPIQEPCDFVASGDDSISIGGCADSEESATFASDPNEEQGSPPMDGPVTVYTSGETATFSFDVIGAERTADLTEWLQENGYNVSDNMTPVMDVYNAPTMRFLALKLRDGKVSSDITPIKMTYTPPNPERPTIPIQLTAVAAQPQMGILVFIAADRPYRTSNYIMDDPNNLHVLLDRDNNTNYFEAVARKADSQDGKLFFSEYIGPNPLRGDIAKTHLSRFYTRMSPQHMDLDPTFRPHDNRNFSRPAILDLTSTTTLYKCGALLPEREPSVCAFNYCGEGGTCAVIDGEASCICNGDSVAQRITGPDGNPTVTCAPPFNPFGVTDEAAGVGTPNDPCLNVNCGQGTCVVLGGFPSCECEQGSAACLEGTSSVTCVPIPPDAPTFGSGAGPESAGATASALRRTQPLTDRRAFGSLLPLLLALCFPVFWRAVIRRREG